MALKQELVTRITLDVMTCLQRGNPPWRRPISSLPKNLLSHKPYRGMNSIALLSRAASEGYASEYWLTYRQANALGGGVRRGERGTPILFYQEYERRSVGSNGGFRVERIPVPRHYTVFNRVQCVGIPDGAVPTSAGCGHTPVGEAERLLGSGRIAPVVHHERCPTPYYSPIEDRIHLPAARHFARPNEYYAVAMHEAVHSTGHASRLGRHTDENYFYGSRTYSKEELVAEMGACFLLGHLGMEGPVLENAAAYCASWLQVLQDRLDWIFVAAGHAQKAADYILGDSGGGEESE